MSGAHEMPEGPGILRNTRQEGRRKISTDISGKNIGLRRKSEVNRGNLSGQDR